MAPVSLTDLPNEVIQLILTHLPPFDNLALQRTCRHFVDVCNEPLVWKSYCQDTYQYWDYRHRRPVISRGPPDTLSPPSPPSSSPPSSSLVGYTTWKELFESRHETNRMTRQAINNIIHVELGRFDALQPVLDAGYDAKDALIELYCTARGTEFHLAQQYWSHAAIGCIHRMMAVEEWKKIKAGTPSDPNFAYELILASFDMFILEERNVGDTSDILLRLYSHGLFLRREHPNVDSLTPRQKAILIAEFLLEHKLIGIQGNRHYHSLDHMFLGISLFSANRNSVPLVSAIIYCSVARQFGLRASPCNYPFHVHVLVQPPEGIDLDGHTLVAAAEGADEAAQAGGAAARPRISRRLTHMYMDPFNNAVPVSRGKLERQLEFVAPGCTAEDMEAYLSPASPIDMAVRVAHNLLASHSHAPGPPIVPITGNLATYAALFALVLLPEPSPLHPEAVRQHMAVLTQHFLEYFDLDVALFEAHILPMALEMPDSNAYRNLIRQLREADHEARPPKRRSVPDSEEGEDNAAAAAALAAVKYRVGQVFRHRRRGYLAVIYGWDPMCNMQEQWITMNQVDRLPQGRKQPFYNVLVEDESTRYVAQENVVLLEKDELTDAVVLAFPIEIGKWFRRYDKEKGVFVSNVQREYPDD